MDNGESFAAFATAGAGCHGYFFALIILNIIA
jgi:hypothetical protein